MADPRRTVRIFISSDFHDMRAERDALERVVFPDLRRRAAALGVEVVKFDPCYGTREDEAEGDAAAAGRLAQIEKSTQYLVTLAGERYGKSPKLIPAHLSALLAGEDAIANPSFLDIEARLALRLNLRHFYYLRNPLFISEGTVPRADFLAETGAAAIALGGLRRRLRTSGAVGMDGYPCRWSPARREIIGLEAFIRQVTEDLWKAIAEDHGGGAAARRPRLRMVLQEDRELRDQAEFDGPVTIGRQGHRDEPPFTRTKLPDGSHRWVVAPHTESSVSRNQLTIEPLADNRARVHNPSQHPVRFTDLPDLPPGTSSEVPLPVIILLGSSRSLRVHRAGAASTRGPEGKPRVEETPADLPLTGEGLGQQPAYAHKNVQFTVYRPRAVEPGQWYPLLAFAHLDELPDDAPPDEPDPVAEVKRQARRVLGPRAGDYKESTKDSRAAVPPEGEITFVPRVAHVTFNPPTRTFLFVKNVHREEFDLRADARLAGQTARGALSVYLGSILIAEVPLSVRVERGAAAPRPQAPADRSTARPYRKIFASYSHKDLAVVEELERYARTLGDRYLRDWAQLRAGEVWSDELRRLIEEADIFQLFWSTNAMSSPFVEQEWRHALSLNRPNFVRPTYWEKPFPMAPARGLPPAELGRLHFHFFGHEAGAAPPEPVEAPAAGAAPYELSDIPESEATAGPPLLEPLGPPRRAPAPPPPPPARHDPDPSDLLKGMSQRRRGRDRDEEWHARAVEPDEAGRPWWKRRGVLVALGVAFGVIILAVVALVLWLRPGG